MDLTTEIYQLARLGIAGKRRDLELYIQRMAQKLASSDPEIAEKLAGLLRGGPTPWRNAAPVPVDGDSHLHLARIEEGIVLDKSPIFDAHMWEALEQIVRERRMTVQLLRKGILPSKTLLLEGPPGVGKTMTARWVAATLEKPLVTLDLSTVMSSYLGKTGVNLRNVLDFAKQHDCVLLLDEFDAIAKRRDDDTEIGELKRLVTVLLQEVDLWPETGLLIAATNHGELLDPAVWRRFDLVLKVPMPSPEKVEEIIRLYLGKDDSKNEKVVQMLSTVWRDRSPSDLARGVAQVKRYAVVFQKKLFDAALAIAGADIRESDTATRKQLVPSLAENGFSQRTIADFTGLARDTVRKALKPEKKAD